MGFPVADDVVDPNSEAWFILCDVTVLHEAVNISIQHQHHDDVHIAYIVTLQRQTGPFSHLTLKDVLLNA